MTRTPLSRSKGQRSPGHFTHRDVNASGSCSCECGNVLALGTYCYVAVCTLQARRREALWRPQREERGGGILWRPPAYSLLYMILYSARCNTHPCFMASIPGQPAQDGTRMKNHSGLNAVSDDGGSSGANQTILRAKLSSDHHHQNTNTQFFTGQMPFLPANQQCHSTTGNEYNKTNVHKNQTSTTKPNKLKFETNHKYIIEH